jgi:hypothetical protein
VQDPAGVVTDLLICLGASPGAVLVGMAVLSVLDTAPATAMSPAASVAFRNVID